MATAYDNVAFWKSYARLWFTDPKKNSEIQCFAKKIGSKLFGIVKDNVLNVLCLGIGVGSHEIPLLFAIRDIFGWRINLVGIDRANGPLNVVNHLLSRESFKSANEFAAFVGECFEMDDLESYITCLDLDQKEWFSSIEEQMHSSRFDLVVASLCLHHLQRWRSVIVEALSLMSDGGLFLLSRADGDVRLFNGEFGGGEMCDKEEPLCEMMRSFWNNLKREGLRRTRHRSSGISPIDQLCFLNRMPLEQVSLNIGNNECNILSSLSTSDVLKFVELKGLSPFRDAALFLGDDVYNRVYNELASEFSMDVEFETKCKLVWFVFRLPNRELLKAHPISQKFSTICNNACVCDSDISRELVSLFELDEAFAASQDAFNTNRLATSNFVSSLERLAFGGVLHDDCVGGVLGQQLVQRERVSDVLHFANPLSKHDTATGLKEHLAFVTSSPTTNTSTLLSKIIPQSKHPVILTFSLREDKRNKYAKIGVTQGRSFISINFELTIPEDIKVELRNTDWYKALGRVNGEQTLCNESGSMSEIVKGWIPQAATTCEPDNKFAQLVITLFEQLKGQMNQTCGLATEYHDLINRSLVNSACSLSLVTGWTDAAIYPLVYLHPETQCFASVDALIILYNRRTDGMKFDAMLQREYSKFSTVFDQLSMRRLATVSIKDGIDQTFGAFSHEISKLSSFLELGLFQPMNWVFDLANSIRSTTEKATGKWTQSAGTITPNPAIEEVIDQWRVCPIPEAVVWATDYLFLWAGTAKRIDKFSSSEPLSLEAFFVEANKIAVNSQFPAFARQSDWHLEDVVQFQTLKTKWLKKLAKIDLSAVQANCVVLTKDKEFVGTVLRALVASLANALKNSPESNESTIKATCELGSDSRVKVQVTNEPRPNVNAMLSDHRDDGTRAVLRNCLRKFPNFDHGLIFEPMGDQWITKFFLPVFTGSETDAENEWIRLEN